MKYISYNMKKKFLLAVLIFVLVIGIVAIVRLSGNDIVTNKGNTAAGESLVSGNSQEQTNQDGNSGSSGSQGSGVVSSDLSQHNSQDDCWIAYDGKVYDITSWLPKHPGGINRILPYCGTADEFQNAFRKQHGTSKVSLLMQVGTFMGDFDYVGTVI